MDRNVVTRVTFAVIAIPLALAIVWNGGVPMVALVSIVSALGARELYDLARKREVQPLSGLGVATAALLPWLAYYFGDLTGVATSLRLALAPMDLVALWLMLLLTVGLARRSPAQQPLGALAVTAFGVLYAGMLPAFLVAIRHGQHGPRSWAGTWLVFFPLVVTWICDTAAMFGGRAVGGPKLAPTVSPGKTRSGAISGVVGGLLVVPFFALWVFPRVGVTVPWTVLAGIAVAIGVLGQVGDLAESLFKREAGVKDSSSLIPGHGGVLDRFDSLYFAIPLAAIGYRLAGIL